MPWDEASYKAHRRKQYELWLHYCLPEKEIMPPWDLLIDDPQYFYKERERWLYRYHVLGERPTFDPSLYPHEQFQALADWKETWFIADEPVPLFGKSTEERIQDIHDAYVRKLEAEKAGVQKRPRRRRVRDQADDEGIAGHDEQRRLEADEFSSSEDYYRYKIESGLVASADYEPTMGTGPQAAMHLAFHPMPKPRRATTTFITAEQFGNCYGAVAFANAQSSLMNTHVSITWSTVGMDLDKVVEIRRKALCELMCKFLVKTLGVPFHMIWVTERGSKRGLHTHMLLHVPPRWKQRFEAAVNKAVETVTGEKPMRTAESSTVYVRQVKKPSEQWFLFEYLMKGVYRDPDMLDWRQREKYDALVKALDLPAKDQGQISGQRVGTSRALGKAQRKTAGFASLWDQGVRNPKELFSESTFISEEIKLLLATISV